MYTVTKNTKLTSLVLMLIGVVALGYGFIQGAGHHTDEEVTHQIEAFAHDLQLHMVDHTDAHHKAVKTAHKSTHDHHSVEEAHFAPLFHKIEEEFHLHFTNEEMMEAHDVEHVIHSTIHALHAKAQRPWSSLLVAAIFFLGASLLSVFFLALQYVAEVGWSAILKRVFMAIGSFLPYVAVVILLIILTGGLHMFGNHTYHWMADGIMDPESKHYDKIIAGKEAFLDTTFFLARSIFYILVWIYFGRKLKQLSLAEDQHGGLSYYNKGVKTSAWFIVFFAVTSSVAAWDWIMSIDTHWFSTLFGWYVFSEWAVIGFATILLITLYLKRLGYMSQVNDSHIHDLGKWVFAFSLVWTYMWFSQFMLIWYSNIPEEGAYFNARIEPETGYRFLFWFSMIINFIVPIVILMSRDAKRHNGRLIFVCIIILIGHWINSFLLVAPGTLKSHGHIGFTEIGMGLGYFGLFIYVVLNSLAKVPLEAKNHPFLDESKHLHT